MCLGENIKKYLVENGISQSFVSEKTGIKRGTLNYMLNGSRRICVDEYVAICQALSIPFDYFIDMSNKSA